MSSAHWTDQLFPAHPDIKRFAEEAGWRSVELFFGLSIAPLTAEATRLVLVARKGEG